MQITHEELMKFCAQMAEKDVELARMRWEQEARKTPLVQGAQQAVGDSCITLSLDRVCAIFKELKGNQKYVTFLFFVLQKMMPQGMPIEVAQRINEVASLEGIPMNISAAGDVNVQGNYTDVHGNGNVKI